MQRLEILPQLFGHQHVTLYKVSSYGSVDYAIFSLTFESIKTKPYH